MVPDIIYLNDPHGYFEEGGCDNTVTWSEDRVYDNDIRYMRFDENMATSLIEEAIILAHKHPSKDCRMFAQNVYNFLVKKVGAADNFS